MNDHETYRELVGAYVLGALNADDRRGFEAHLADCQRCRDELVELAPIPGLLGQVSIDDLVSVPSTTADAVLVGARAHLTRLQVSRRRWRLAAGGAAAAVLILLGVALAGWVSSNQPDEQDQVVLAFDAAPAVEGTLAASERTWGTYLHLSLEGLPWREVYRIWVVDQAGTWHEAGSWLPTPDGSARLGGSTHLRLADIDLLVVTSEDRSDHLLEALAR